jgi:hypothetical protein
MIQITKHIKLFLINKCIKLLLTFIINILNLYILLILFESIYIKTSYQYIIYNIIYKYNINYTIKIGNLLSKSSIIFRIE